MIDIIKGIVEGRWFKEPSPFRCSLQIGHPKLCVITGKNASGKSVIRKILHNHHDDHKLKYMVLSQEGRCASGGFERLFLYGTEKDESTGYNSVKMLLKAIQSGQSWEQPFGMMIDEPEIGCSEETQAAMGLRIARDFDTLPQLNGMFIITHSRQLVKNLLSVKPTHWRLEEDGLSLEQWVEREVVPCDLEALLSEAKEKWHLVNAMTKKS